MPNMDYPGPCFSCSAIDGCSSDAQKSQAVKQYCKGLELELSAWKSRLYDVLVSVGEMNPTDQASLKDTLLLIKSTMKELERTAEQLQQECPSSMTGTEQLIGDKLEQLRAGYTKALEVISPGWFGG